ncbi:MAG: hypothetical protein HY298_16870 [Verrucomicrobia bacterium]|nr:hypothetical protein [Verrucomicrobiota bacterium]
MREPQVVRHPLEQTSPYSFMGRLVAAGLILFSNCAIAGSVENLRLAWQTNVLKISGDNLPGGTVDIWWLEAFCRRGSTKRPWNETTIPHTTELLSADQHGQWLRLRSKVQPSVEVLQDLRVVTDGVEIMVELKNSGDEPADLEWFEPCIHVDRFTGRNQTNYIERCFIFTERGLTTLDQLPRNEEALYRGGQVYVPKGINHDDVNPRPISPVTPANGLIGCFSADNQYLLATAWDQTQHLFQGVIVCIHSDPHVGGLKRHETKKLRGKIYLMKNDPAKLLKQYQRDFPDQK